MLDDLQLMKSRYATTPSHALLRIIARHADQRVIRRILSWYVAGDWHWAPQVPAEEVERVDAITHALKPCPSRAIWRWVDDSSEEFTEITARTPEVLHQSVLQEARVSLAVVSLAEVRIAWAVLRLAYAQGWGGKHSFWPEEDGGRIVKACVIAAEYGFQAMIASRTLAERSIPYWHVNGDALADFRARADLLETLTIRHQDRLREAEVQDSIERQVLEGSWDEWKYSGGLRQGSLHWVRSRQA